MRPRPTAKAVELAAKAFSTVVAAAQTELAGSVAVAGVALALHVLGIGFDKVAGGLVIVFAAQLSRKRLAPEVKVDAKVPRDWQGFAP